MAVTHLGSKTVGQICLSIGIAIPALSPALSDLLSRIAALQAQINSNAATLAIPPDPLALAAALAAAAAEVVAQIPQIIASIPTPLLEANVGLASDVAALLSLKTLLENAVTTLNGAASAGGVHAFSVDSTAAAVGAELAGQVSTGLPGGGLPGARVYGLILLTEAPATFSAMSSVLLTA